MWLAHTICFYLQFPCVLKFVVTNLSPWQVAMGKASAKVLGARVAVCTWPTRLHYVCDNDFGAHAILPWKCLTKVLVVILQASVWYRRQDKSGLSQLLLKIVVTLWSLFRLWRVFACRMQLAKTMLREIRECHLVPGVNVEE